MQHVEGRKQIHSGVLVEKSEGGRPLGTPRHRWEDNIEMDLKEIG
jgi:hypothetical protein